MASLIVGQAHPVELLGLIVQVDGKLVDCTAAPTFRIEDISTLPATTLQSSTAGTNVGTGRYVAKVAGVAWTPAAEAASARIVWTFTPPGGSETTISKTFEVADDDAGLDGRHAYATIAEVRELFGEVTAVSDRRIRDTILEFGAEIERHCGHRFYTKYETRKIKGKGGRILFLDEPLFALGSVCLNNDTSEFSNTYFRVLSDDRARWNPKIEFDESSITAEYGGLFVAQEVRSMDFDSKRYQTIAGVWGFVDEATQQAPSLVRQACAIGAGLTLKAKLEGNGTAIGAPGLVRREETDAHSIDYSVAGRTSVAGMISILRDPVVRELLAQYRKPFGLAWVG